MPFWGPSFSQSKMGGKEMSSPGTQAIRGYRDSPVRTMGRSTKKLREIFVEEKGGGGQGAGRGEGEDVEKGTEGP